MINLSKNNYWTFIFMIMTTNVYLISESLQLSNLISSSSHNTATIYIYAYNLLYSWLTTYVIIKMSDLVCNKPPNIFLYYVFYILGAVGFALLGEIPFLKNLAIVPGFWNHLDIKAKITIIVFAVIIFFIGLIQLKQAIKDKDCLRHLFSYLFFILFYGITLSTLLISGASSLNIHVHHAIFASLLSFWFVDWNSNISLIFHAILMGVVVEGIDFYGIGELSLFLCNIGNLVSLKYTILISISFFIMTIPFIIYFNIYKYNFIKANHRINIDTNPLLD